MKLSRETNDKVLSLPKTQSKNNNIRKTISCLYQFANIKTEFKEIKEERMHTNVYTGSL